MMLTPRWPSAGPTGGLGFAPPAGIWSLTSAITFFATTPPLSLLDLDEVELDGRRAAEDADQHPQLALVGLDLFDDAVEVLERSVDDLDALASLEQDLGLDGALFHLLRDLADLGLADRRRIVRATDEAGHPRRRLDETFDVVAEDADIDQDVARKELPGRRPSLTLDELDDFLGRDEHLTEGLELLDRALQVRDRRKILVRLVGLRFERGEICLLLRQLAPATLVERRLHLGLVTRVGVDDVPARSQVACGSLRLAHS